MNTTVFTWKILNMEAIMSYNDLTDVVRTVFWQLEGHDDDNKYGRHWGIQQLDVDSIDSSSFTSYSSLTESQVIAWTKASILALNPVEEGEPNFITRMENEIQAQMDSEEIGSRRTGTPW